MIFPIGKTDKVIDLHNAFGVAGDQNRVVVIAQLMRLIFSGRLVSKAVGKITFNAKDVLEAGFFCCLLFGGPVQQGTVVGGTKGSHAALNGQVNVILIFGAGIKDRAFVIVKVITEVIWTGNFYSPPVIYFKSPAGAGNGWSWAAPWLKQISFGFRWV